MWPSQGTFTSRELPEVKPRKIAEEKTIPFSLARLRQIIDTQGDPIMELALADLFLDGTIKRTLKKALKEYRHRRDFVCAALSSQLSDKIEFKVPDGGLSIRTRDQYSACHYPKTGINNT